MTRTRWMVAAALALAVGLAACGLASGEEASPAAKKINVVIVTGGHGFDEKPFLAMFEAMKDVTFTHAPQKDDSEIFEDTSDWKYDVIVFYNMGQKITEKRQKNLLALLDKGVGVVTLHHALAAYQDWPDFQKIAGGKFYLKEAEVNGAKRGTSGAKDGVTHKIHVEDPNHPITKGVQDFTVVDETYCRYTIDPKSHALLTTDEPTSDKVVGWAGTFGKARTCYLINGHDAKVYGNASYQALVANAVRWAAGRTGEPAEAAALAPTRVTVYAAPAAADDQPAAASGKKIRAVVVTGGHDFEEKPFMAVFEAMSGVAFTHAPQKDDSEIFEDTSDWKYDVVVLYNMSQRISEKRQKNFLALIEKGVGVVTLHHALGAWQDWPEYEKIVGGKFYTKDTVVNGAKRPPSTYKHGVDFKVHVEDAAHPITKGVKDFQIHDETYGRYGVDPKVHVLLTTDEPSCEKSIGWTSPYGKGRTCFLLLGHDGKAYENPGYRALVTNALRWAAGR